MTTAAIASGMQASALVYGPRNALISARVRGQRDRRALVGHRSTTVTETVYRKQLRPVIEGGADVMNRIFPREAGPGA